VHYNEHLPPDPTSAMFWLKNRDPDNWRDVQVDHVLGKYIIRDRPMTEEEWAREHSTVIDAEPPFDDGREENHSAAGNRLLKPSK
jgi:hypothetical protein